MVRTSDCGSDNKGSIPLQHIFALIVHRFRTLPCHGRETSSILVKGVKSVLVIDL